jgi:GNAT superfamily N-acetyltransferase
MSLSIRPVDPWDEDEMDVLQALYVEAHRAEVPDARVYSRADSVAFLRHSGSEVFYHAFVACQGDEIRGQVWVVGNTTANAHLGDVWAWVPPRYGRRGIGTALARHGEDHLRQLGRRTAVTQTWIGDGSGGYRAFAERLGYTLAQTQVERRQPLPVPEQRLAALEAEAAGHAGAYRIRTVVGPIPDELTQGYCDVYNLLNLEMPTGELELEASRRTPDELVEQEDELRAAGRTRVTAFALAADGSVVGYSCAVTGPADAPEAADRAVDQWSTLVHPDHRGHRLGLGVKCALTRAIQEHFPDRTYVRTQNAETNAPMVSINEALGFAVHSIEGEFQKHLD